MVVSFKGSWQLKNNTNVITWPVNTAASSLPAWRERREAAVFAGYVITITLKSDISTPLPFFI